VCFVSTFISVQILENQRKQLGAEQMSKWQNRLLYEWSHGALQKSEIKMKFKKHVIQAKSATATK